jgi:hypothetical protein
MLCPSRRFYKNVSRTIIPIEFNKTTRSPPENFAALRSLNSNKNTTLNLLFCRQKIELAGRLFLSHNGLQKSAAAPRARKQPRMNFQRHRPELIFISNGLQLGAGENVVTRSNVM